MMTRNDVGTKCNEKGSLYMVMKGGDFDAYLFVEDEKTWWIFNSIVNAYSAMLEAVSERPELVNRYTQDHPPISTLSYNSKDKIFTLYPMTNNLTLTYMLCKKRSTPKQLENLLKNIIKKSKNIQEIGIRDMKKVTERREEKR